MIIQLLGANGAGKSTIVKHLLSEQTAVAIKFLGRKRPDAMLLDDVFIAGHYEGSACGGADTLPATEVQMVLRKMLEGASVPVLIEGPTGREPTLPGDVRAIYIRRDHEDNFASWSERQLAKGLLINRDVMMRRIRSTTKRCDNIVQEYTRRGLIVTTTSSREAAEATIRKILRRD